MHKILGRQLRRLHLDPIAPPDQDDWEKFLDHVENTYRQADQDRYLLERSLAISSKETQELYNQEQHRVQEALRVSEGKYRTLFEHAVDSIFIIDVESRKILDVNQVAAGRLGYSREELLSMTIDDLYPPFELARNAAIIEELQQVGNLTFERIHVRKDGTTMPVEVSSTVLEQDGRLVYQSIARDITQRKVTERELQRLANYDSLTGVANRSLFIERLTHAIEIARRNKTMLAVLFLDLDGFKAVNDAFGHARGDTLLQIIAKRVVEGVRKSDTVGRLGGDEFAILLEGLKGPEEIVAVVEKIINLVSEPFMMLNAEAFITSSIGVSIFPQDGEDADTLIQNADRAMYASKSEGKNNYRFFVTAMKTSALERLELGNQFRHALERQELIPFYQVQIDSRTGVALGVEALARWRHPILGILQPEKFIDLAEEMGLTLPLSSWMLQTACNQMNQWLQDGIPPLRLAINLADRDLRQPDLAARIQALLDQASFPAHLLELELSENTIFRNFDTAERTLLDLKNLGVRLAIDDFGTGYSTLSQLALFPFDTLKIDRRFAANLRSSTANAAIVSGIVTIGHNLGMDVIAEGVETQEQLKFYQNAGCFNIQGWLFHEPMVAEEAVAALRKSSG